MSENIFIKQQRAALLQQYEDLKTLSETTPTDSVELDQSKIGRLSRMDAMQQQAMQEEQQRRRLRKMKRIQAALARIEADDYGWCADCGEEINPRRLEVDPSAVYCTQCADKH